MNTEDREKLVNKLAEKAKEFGIVQTPFGPALQRDGAGRFLKATFGSGSGALLAKVALVADAGPPFHLASNRSLYPVQDLITWALSRFSEARSTHPSGKKRDAA